MSSGKNKFCNLGDLSNESTVEQFFASRLLSDLGYSDKQIKPKTSLDKLKVSIGSKKYFYRPDYALSVRRKIHWIMEAKAVTEPLNSHVEQPAGYCLLLNRKYSDGNPVKYFVLTNGVLTQVFEWDSEAPILELSFSDFDDSNEKYTQLQDLLNAKRFLQPLDTTKLQGPTHTLYKRSISDVNSAFAYCHQFIHRKDDFSQGRAFMEFVKIIFLKLLSDRAIHEKHPEFANMNQITLPASEVKFSSRWLKERENDHPNPIDAIQFQALLQKMEAEIQSGTKKRIFDNTDHITLGPETIKGVVERLEDTDLYGIDADLNGRLFETFLNATMRGKDLGQYFTPRSIVKLAVKLANIKVDRTHIDTVIDACCGSGGFLIDVLADMRAKVDANLSLTDKERQDFKRTIATKRIYGIDVARDPVFARIARMNMYLHGDGGSCIFQADALDKNLLDSPAESPELNKELIELRKLIGKGNFAEVVITNPPFAKDYEQKLPRERRILKEYDLSYDDPLKKQKPLQSLKSSLMFLERYRDLLKPGGTLITVIDDSILGGPKYQRVRDFIRTNYIVRAVVSIPGDGFQRSQARVKTSLLCLQKKNTPSETQPPVFMSYTRKVGIDDPARRRILPIDKENREIAQQEIDEITNNYRAFLKGEKIAKQWTVQPEKIKDRLDVKSCLLNHGRKKAFWKNNGNKVHQLGDLVEIVFPSETDDIDQDRFISTKESDELVTHLRVRYDGFAEEGEKIFASDSTYNKLYRVKENDIAISNIGAVHGAIAVVPKHLEGLVVTTEYTIFRAKTEFDPRIIWALIRSPEVRSDLLLLATGISRHRVKWENVRILDIPEPSKTVIENVVNQIQTAEKYELKARELRKEAQKEVEKSLDLDNEVAQNILEAFKPPD